MNYQNKIHFVRFKSNQSNFLIILALFFTFFNAHAQTYNLVFDLKLNETYYQNMKSEVLVSQKANGQSIDIKIKMNSKTSFKIIDIKKDIFYSKVTYEDINMNMDMGSLGGSNETVNQMMNSMMNSIKGKHFYMEMNNKGKVIKITGVDSIFSGLFDSVPNLSETEINQLKTQIMDTYGEQNFKSAFEQTMAFFPKKPIGVGEKWNVEMETKTSNFNLNINGDFILKEVSTDYYIITGVGKTSTPKKNETTKANGMEMKLKLDGTMTFNIKVDKKTGWVISYDSEMNINGINEILPNSSFQNGLKIPINMTGTINMTN